LFVEAILQRGGIGDWSRGGLMVGESIPTGLRKAPRRSGMASANQDVSSPKEPAVSWGLELRSWVTTAIAARRWETGHGVVDD
jgi:hypothetical protein